MTVTLRNNKGSALTHSEMDANFTDFMTLSGTGAGRTITALYAPDFNSTSDLRLKENIEKITSAIDKIYEVNGYTFNFKNDDTKKRKYGLVAQELVKNFPELVSMGEDGYLKVSYDSAIPILLEALKRQKSDIDNLKEELANLKKDLGK